MSRNAPSNTSQREAPRNHRIFQICLQCGYDTLRFSERPLPRGPTYRCPECEAHKFITSCSICEFERSSDCPFTQLLEKSLTAKVEDSDEVNEQRGRSRSRSGSRVDKHYEELSATLEEVALESTKKKATKFKRAPTGYPPRSSQIKDQESAGSITTLLSRAAEDKKLEPETCEDCRQAQCTSCKPEFRDLVVDMGDYSKTFAEDFRLCTLCGHGLCPGNQILVHLRCRDCGHNCCDGCSVTLRNCANGEGVEEWCVCCKCQEII